MSRRNLFLGDRVIIYVTCFYKNVGETRTFSAIFVNFVFDIIYPVRRVFENALQKVIICLVYPRTFKDKLGTYFLYSVFLYGVYDVKKQLVLLCSHLL